MELTGLKPVSLLGLSHIPHGQGCLQKLTVEKIGFNTNFCHHLPGVKDRGGSHTHRDLWYSRWRCTVHVQPSLWTWAPGVLQTLRKQPALQLASSSIASGVTGQTQAAGQALRYSGLWQMRCKSWRCYCQVLPSFPKAFIQPFCWRWQNQHGVGPSQGHQHLKQSL